MSRKMDLAKIDVVTDGGPWAEHNMPCAVCRKAPAVLYLNEGIFEPCWECQQKGWKLSRNRSLWSRLFGDAARPEEEKRG